MNGLANVPKGIKIASWAAEQGNFLREPPTRVMLYPEELP